MEPPIMNAMPFQHMRIYSIALLATIALIWLLVRPRKWQQRLLCITVCTMIGLIMPFIAVRLAMLPWLFAPEPPTNTWLTNAQYNRIFAQQFWTWIGFTIAGGIVGGCMAIVDLRRGQAS